MPKKFKGENSKAAEAKERKSAQKADEAARKQAAEEDAFWADDDKHIVKKQQRKDQLRILHNGLCSLDHSVNSRTSPIVICRMRQLANLTMILHYQKDLDYIEC
ncbi:hypothetical protein DPMN_111936 [Dreissena polymorpha]|uniref:Uncharacterized protein n=2 Tax=Dreissena polymorpha TaxID=45954 RepID=A0A9D4KG47_DREPO|nr:hypothetical protein DPMN_111936 [Dreissena polymorpha]